MGEECQRRRQDVGQRQMADNASRSGASEEMGSPRRLIYIPWQVKQKSNLRTHRLNEGGPPLLSLLPIRFVKEGTQLKLLPAVPSYLTCSHSLHPNNPQPACYRSSDRQKLQLADATPAGVTARAAVICRPWPSGVRPPPGAREPKSRRLDRANETRSKVRITVSNEKCHLEGLFL